MFIQFPNLLVRSFLFPAYFLDLKNKKRILKRALSLSKIQSPKEEDEEGEEGEEKDEVKDKEEEGRVFGARRRTVSSAISDAGIRTGSSAFSGAGRRGGSSALSGAGIGDIRRTRPASRSSSLSSEVSTEALSEAYSGDIFKEKLLYSPQQIKELLSLCHVDSDGGVS